jgi:hypothetical protein
MESLLVLPFAPQTIEPALKPTTQLNNELVSSPKRTTTKYLLQSWSLPPVHSGPLSMKHTNFRDPPSRRTQIAHLMIRTNGLKQETPEASERGSQLQLPAFFVHGSEVE